MVEDPADQSDGNPSGPDGSSGPPDAGTAGDPGAGGRTPDGVDGGASGVTGEATGGADPREEVASIPGVVGVVGGLFLLSTAAAAYEIAPASVLPVIRSALGIGPAAAGWLVSVMYATAVVTSVPVGFGLDRLRVRRVVAAAGIALLIAGWWGWVAAGAGGYWSLVLSRVLGGLSFVVVWNAGADVVGRVVPARFRATVVGAFTASAPAGFALGQFGAPQVADALGWPAIFPAFAAVGALGMVAFWAGGRWVEIAVDAGTPDLAALYRLFTNRRAWTLYGLCFLAYSLYLFLNSWLPSYLSEGLGLSLATGGLLTALFPAVGILARPSGGLISDRLFGGRRRPVVVGSFALVTPAVFGFTVITDLAPLVGLVVAAGVAVQLAIGLLFSYVAEVVAPAVTTTAIATMTSVGLLGAFVAPIAAGAVIARAGYVTAFVLAGTVAAVGLALSWWAPESA